MEGVGVGAIILACITMLKNVVDVVINRLAKKDQMQQDVKVALMEERLSLAEADRKELRADLANCQAHHEESEKDRKDLRKKLDETEAKALQLKDEVAELKKLVGKQQQPTRKSHE